MGKWTEEEIKVLKKYYRKKGAQYVVKFVDHSADTVMGMAAKLGVRYEGLRQWREWEDRYIKRHINDRKHASMAATLNRSLSSVHARIQFLKLSEPKAAKWTEQEKEILCKFYPDRSKTLGQISTMLKRSRNGVLLKAKKMGLSRSLHIHKWTKKEHNYLLKNAEKKTYKEIGDYLGISPNVVGQHANKAGIKIGYKGPLWSDEEKDFLKSNYKKLSNKEIALQLNRSDNAVMTTARKMGLTVNKSQPWTEKEINYLESNYGKIPNNKITEALERTTKAIMAKAEKLNLTKKKKKKTNNS